MIVASYLIKKGAKLSKGTENTETLSKLPLGGLIEFLKVTDRKENFLTNFFFSKNRANSCSKNSKNRFAADFSFFWSFTE